MKSYKAYLIDLDGTLYQGDKGIQTAIEFIQELLTLNIPFKFVTNNATRTTAELVEWIKQSFNLSITDQHVYTSTMALLDYVHQHYQDKEVYVIGESALLTQIKQTQLKLVKHDQANLVIQGLDRQANYNSLSIAVRAILNGADFLVTNADRLIPFAGGMNPSSGAITSFIQFATGKEALVFGKPNAPIIKGALASLNVSPEDVLLIGDNYETDILAGINEGIDTLLVLTGVTQRIDLENIEKQPTYIIEDLSHWSHQ